MGFLDLLGFLELSALVALLALWELLELFGIEWSMYLLIIGGLWEIIFAVRLILRLDKKA